MRTMYAECDRIKSRLSRGLYITESERAFVPWLDSGLSTRAINTLLFIGFNKPDDVLAADPDELGRRMVGVDGCGKTTVAEVVAFAGRSRRVDPFAGFTSERLIAELERRGYVVGMRIPPRTNGGEA